MRSVSSSRSLRYLLTSSHSSIETYSPAFLGFIDIDSQIPVSAFLHKFDIEKLQRMFAQKISEKIPGGVFHFFFAIITAVTFLPNASRRTASSDFPPTMHREWGSPHSLQ